jgi:hypothetical protein
MSRKYRFQPQQIACNGAILMFHLARYVRRQSDMIDFRCESSLCKGSLGLKSRAKFYCAPASYRQCLVLVAPEGIAADKLLR